MKNNNKKNQNQTQQKKKRMKSQKNQNGSKPNRITMYVPPFRKEEDAKTNQMMWWNNYFDH